jgi:Flp pilus assembly pilin Flp
MSRVRKFLHNYLNDESGAGMVEYGLLVSLVGILLIGSLVELAGGIDEAFDTAEKCMEAADTATLAAAPTC